MPHETHGGVGQGCLGFFRLGSSAEGGGSSPCCRSSQHLHADLRDPLGSVLEGGRVEREIRDDGLSTRRTLGERDDLVFAREKTEPHF